MCPHNWAVGALEQPLHSYFFVLLGSRATPLVHSHWGERQLHAIFTPTHWGCCREKLSPSRHENNLCSFGPISVLVSHGCLCASSPIDVCLCVPYHCFCICSWPVTCKLIGLDTLLTFSYIPLFQLCFSLCYMFPCAMEQNPSSEWLYVSSLTLCPLPLTLSVFETRFSVLFFYLFIIFIFFWVIKDDIGLTSHQTIACSYFHLFFGFLNGGEKV